MMKYIRLFLFLGIGIHLSACQSLPSLDDRVDSIYIPTVRTPRLDQALHLPVYQEIEPDYPAIQSDSKEQAFAANVYVLDQAHDAFVARATLIDHADVSIDAQYYIWRQDVSGGLLLQKLWQAAERGVRVRLLLDDNNTRGMDNVLMALNTHPNVEIRLFNPFLYRRWRALGYLTDFPRLNRRMHNKSLTIDNRASVIGGRNIGDEYFDMGSESIFADMDVLVSGKIVTRISQEFDRYWNSNSSYPIDNIIRKFNLKKGLVQLHQDRSQVKAYRTYMDSLQFSPIVQAMQAGNIPFIQAKTQLVSDDPAKALDKEVQVDVAAEIQAALGQPQQKIYLVSPYFVPTQAGLGILEKMVQSNVKTTILTNSLAATDVVAVHSGYARYRKSLLQAGVQLYEFKTHKVEHQKNKIFGKDKGLTGSSATSLHAKTFVVDSKRVFVGSFNLDPRSARFNTEMGLVIHHEALAKAMEERLDQEAQNNAYHVSLNQVGKLQWQDTKNTHQPNQTKEPEATFWKKFWAKALSWLPIEKLL